MNWLVGTWVDNNKNGKTYTTTISRTEKPNVLRIDKQLVTFEVNWETYGVLFYEADSNNTIICGGYQIINKTHIENLWDSIYTRTSNEKNATKDK